MRGLIKSLEFSLHPFLRALRVLRGKKMQFDLLIENELVIELKSVAKPEGIHEAQLLTSMKLANIRTGHLINFNVTGLKDGIRRFVLSFTKRNREEHEEHERQKSKSI